MKKIIMLILVIFSLNSCTFKKELYLWNYKRKISKFKFKFNNEKKIYLYNKKK